jgi:DNA-binding IclR family transcriptional regulator
MPRKSATDSLAALDAAPGGVAAVDRALSLLQVFRSGDAPLSLATLAQRTQLHKSSVLRLLASLMHAMLVERLADGRYALSHGLARLHQVYAASYSLERLVMPQLHELVAQTGESAAFHVLWGQGTQLARISLFRVDSPQPIRDHYQPGDLLPLNRGVGAMVLLAHHGAGDFIGDPEVQQDTATVLRQGYLSASGHRDADVAGVAAPVFKSGLGQGTGEAGNALAGALIVTMPAGRYAQAHVAPLLRAAAQLTRLLGGESSIATATKNQNRRST